MLSSLAETIMLLFNTPIVPPQLKKNAADIPLVDLSRGRWVDRGPLTGRLDPEGFALTVRHSHPTLHSVMGVTDKLRRAAALILIGGHEDERTKSWEKHAARAAE